MPGTEQHCHHAHQHQLESAFEALQSCSSEGYPGTSTLAWSLELCRDDAHRLTQRASCTQGRAVLEAIRGTADVDAEYGTIIFAQQREKAAGMSQWQTILKREVRPHLCISIALPFFQMVRCEPSGDVDEHPAT